MADRGPCKRRYVSICTPLFRHSGFVVPCTDADFDPSKAARDARKTKIAKNEKQHQQNLARTQGPSAAAAPPANNADRKKQIDRTLATTRTSTASMGKFDKTLEGEKKPRGVKRKVCYFATSSYTEDHRSLTRLPPV